MASVKETEFTTLRGRVGPTELSEVVHQELEQIRKKNPDKTLQPIDIVNAARKKRSPLHRFFEWDDTAAAEKFRLAQATFLVKAVVRVVDRGGEKKTISAYVSKRNYKTGIGKSGGFEPTAVVVKRKSDRDRLIETKVKQLDRLRQEMETISEMVGLSSDIEEILHEHGFDVYLEV